MGNEGNDMNKEHMRSYDGSSSVERVELQRSGRAARYAPTEKIALIEVGNFPLLGKLTAFRFIEWVQKNPSGVISLPTGKTPEHFIKWVQRILRNWQTREIQEMAASYEIDSARPPEMRSLFFVQIDEFYPMNASQHNSFNYYVQDYYVKGFGLDPAKVLLIDSTSLGLPSGWTMSDVFPDNVVDLSLRVRQTRSELERVQKETINRVDWFCTEYENKIRELGGIGFFLGGIGPDGHIAFNVRGSSFYSVTRLTGTNYETQAAAAGDLGGIEISRSRLVITIGLSTITHNPTATAIIIAAGDAKAGIVRQAVEEPQSPLYPASALHDLPNARFYLTKGAASLLVERKFLDVAAAAVFDEHQVDDVVVSLSLATHKRLDELTASDFAQDRFAARIVQATGASPTTLALQTRERMIAKMERGVEHVGNVSILHTEPHHDDIMLAYLPYLYHLVRDPNNRHHFANLTSGFTAVSNKFFLGQVRSLARLIQTESFRALHAQNYFDPKNMAKRMEDVYLFLDGSAANVPELRAEAEARRLLRSMLEVYRLSSIDGLTSRVLELERYLAEQYPGAKDPAEIQTLKGMIREFEVELLWAYFGIESSAVHPLRLGFYQGDIFSEEPEVHRDVLPVFELMKAVRPNIVSVAFDPEGSGPDTHYKVLQAVAEALRMYERASGDTSIRVWGYRNVWYRFRPAEADIVVPVSLNTLSLTHSAFMNCFGSQSAASFPSYEHDGPFSELAQKIQVEQYGMVKTCLGKEFFQTHKHPRLRAARGLVFLKEMPLARFYDKVRELRKAAEDR